MGVGGRGGTGASEAKPYNLEVAGTGQPDRLSHMWSLGLRQIVTHVVIRAQTGVRGAVGC